MSLWAWWVWLEHWLGREGLTDDGPIRPGVQ